MITIENESFTAVIATQGAELRSLKNKQSQAETIWQADPAVWACSAPVLFPIVGSLIDGKTKIDQTTYSIPKHGILRGRDSELIEQGADYAIFRFSANAEIKELYPYSFTLDVTFRLQENELVVSYAISNSGDEEMICSLGSHPAFALDLKNNALTDYFIEFSEAESLDLYGVTEGIFHKKDEQYLKNESQIPLTESLFNDDALMFRNIRSSTIRIKRPAAESSIEIDTHGTPHLGIWSKPGAAYVCIEPWHSCGDTADSDGLFENKPDMQRLKKGETYETGYTIRVMG